MLCPFSNLKTNSGWEFCRNKECAWWISKELIDYNLKELFIYNYVEEKEGLCAIKAIALKK